MPEPPGTSGGGKTIDLFGHKVKESTALLAGGGIIVLVIGIGWYRSKQAANNAAAQSAATTSANDIDPATGYPAGSPQDEAALQGMNEGDLGLIGSGSSTGAGEIIGYDGDGNPIYASGTTSVPGGFTSNAQWGQAAEQYLGSTGSDSIAAAIAKYLNGQPLTSDQVTVVQEAIAVEGNPPVAGTNGNPPGYLTAPPVNINPGGPAKVSVPNVVGMRADTARQTLRREGLTYNISDNATGSVSAQSPKPGTQVSSGSIVRLTLRGGK